MTTSRADSSARPTDSNATGNANRSGRSKSANGTRTTLPDDFELLIIGPTDGTLGRGGIDRYIHGQVTHLEELCAVSTYSMQTPTTGSGRIKILRGILKGLFALLRFPLRSQPDIVHIHTSHSYSFYRASLYVLFVKFVWGVPVVLHIHGSSFDEFVESASGLRAAYQGYIFHLSDEIIALSQYWKEVLSRRADEVKIRTLPNAVDPTQFPYDIGSDSPHIVVVCNLIERKGVCEMAEAFECLCQSYPGEFQVTVAGAGPLSELFENLDEKYDEVTYLGYISEEHKQSVIEAGSIYLLPAYAEGLPIGLLEGMAGGNAIVATSVGSIPEVVGEGGGIIVEPQNVDELVTALERLIHSPERRRRMGQLNRQLVEKKYSWNRIVEELVTVYASHK